jgi:uncharacterized protein (DUF433 family)
MQRRSIDSHIECTPDVLGGRPRIAGRRIAVSDIVVLHESLGRSVAEISAEFDLTSADVHAALAYYFDHREEMDRAISDAADFVKDLRRRFPSKIGA